MTPKRRQHYTGPTTIIGWSEAFVAMCFVGIWLLWPRNTVQESCRKPYNNSLRYTPSVPVNMEASSVLLNPPSPVQEPESAPNEALIEYWPERVRYLPDCAHTNIKAQDTVTGSALFPEAGAQPKYRLEVPPTQAFTPTKEVRPRLLIQISSELESHGFRAPVIPLEDIETQKTSWQVSALVDLGADGTPDHVFLESGSGDEEIDAQIIRSMYGGRASKPGTACSGLVVVSMGKQ